MTDDTTAADTKTGDATTGGTTPADAPAWLALVRSLERRGELILAFDVAQRGLAVFPDDLRLKHRAVLLLAKSGATRRAHEELYRLGLGGHADADVAALEARIAKDEALAAPPARRAALLTRAADLYDRVYRRDGGYYPGINVATLRLLAGDVAEGERVAADVLARCEAMEDEHDDEAYYVAATRAEALLVLGRGTAAALALGEAALASGDLAARAATRRQCRLVVDAKSIDPAVLDPLAPPSVVHYSGHMISSDGASGRFPAHEEARVAAEIAACLDRHGVGFGYGGLASGADILVAEALLARRAELHVVLPFRIDEFVAVSVAPAGEDWVRRFDACRAGAATLTMATDDRYLGHDLVFTYGSYVAMGLAVLRSRFIDAEVRQIAVWDGRAASGRAGTAVDVGLWRSTERPTDLVAPARAIAAGVPSDRPALPPVTGTERDLRAMLFGDVKGFSKLQEAELPGFVEHVLGTLGRVLAGYGEAVLYANTWGDGIFAVFADPIAAAHCALDLQAALAGLKLSRVGLPDTLALRLGGHFGPVFETYDPIQHVRNYFGAHVSRTARIEPVTPPGEVFVTEAFAARLALGPEHFACDYVGEVPAAKGYGTMRMYHLHRPANAG